MCFSESPWQRSQVIAVKLVEVILRPSVPENRALPEWQYRHVSVIGLSKSIAGAAL
jgi:hypothetical protein